MKERQSRLSATIKGGWPMRQIIISFATGLIIVSFSSVLLILKADNTESPAPSPSVLAAEDHPITIRHWTMDFWEDLSIVGLIGVGGAVLCFSAFPIKTMWDIPIRMINGGIFAALFAGWLMHYWSVAEDNPYMRAGGAGLAGLISYPVLVWLGHYGIGGIVRRSLGIEVINKRKENKP